MHNKFHPIDSPHPLESTMKEAHKRNRNPKYKRKYRVANWPEYDRSLRNRCFLYQVLLSQKPRDIEDHISSSNLPRLSSQVKKAARMHRKKNNLLNK